MYGSNFNTSIVGVTNFYIVAATPTLIKAGANENQFLVKKFSGAVEYLKSVCPKAMADGYIIGDAETVTFDGPAQFYLSATGVSTLVHMVISKTAGATHG